MAAADHTHSPTAEEIMEYLDGEGSIASRETVEAHLAECGQCQVLASEQRRLSERLGTWDVGRAPASVHAPAARPGRVLPGRFRTWRRSLVTLAAAGAAACLLGAIWLSLTSQDYRARRLMSYLEPPASDSQGTVAMSPERPGGDAATSAQLERRDARAGTQTVPRRPSIVRTTTLRIVARDFNAVRPAVESVVAAAGGFLDHLTAIGESGSVRALRGTLRIPADRLAEVTDRLRQLGEVLEDTQQSEDVSEQLVDLDARLAGARTTERRLLELLRTRAAALSDVLEVERELARVRVEVERLDAETTNIGRRVTYATVIIEIVEERKAGLTPGPLSFGSQVRTAASDGLESGLESAAWTLLLLLRAGPVVVLWCVALGSGWLIVRGARARRLRGSRPGPA